MVKTASHPSRWSGLICTALTLILSTAPEAQADERVDARRHFQAGMKLIESGKYDEGISELALAYQILPHPAVLYNLGRACLDAERFEDAQEYLERYLESNPPDRDEAERMLERSRRRAAVTEHKAGSLEGAERSASPSAGHATLPAPELESIRAELRTLLNRLDSLAQVAPAVPSGAEVADERVPAAPVHGVTPPLATAPPGPVAEKGPTDDPYLLEVITSSRYAQRPLESPNAITVLSGDELRQSGVTSIAEALRRVPGVSVMAMNPADYNVGMRGFNSLLSNKVLLLIDGRSIYLDFVGATLWEYLSISMDDIDRIEIIRGPGAALYGAGAFSGVINIITKSAGANQDHPVMSFRASPMGLGIGSVHFSGRQGESAWRASAGISSKRRWSVDIDPERSDYTVLAEYPSLSARTAKFDLRMDRKLGALGTISLSGGVVGGQHEFMAVGALRDYLVDGVYHYLRGDLLLPLGVSVRTFWNHLDADARPWAIPTGALDISSSPVTDLIDFEIEDSQQVNLLAEHRLNAGMGLRYKRAAWEWVSDLKEETHLSFFFQDEMRWNPQLNTVLSLRLDRHPLLTANTEAKLLDRYALSPRGALVWQLLPGHSIRGTIGTAFRTPTFVESYIDQAIPTSTDAVAVHTVGNEELLPERIFSLELGWMNQPENNRHELEATVFMNQINGLIALSNVVPSADTSLQENGYWYAGTATYENIDAPQLAIGAELGGRIYPAEGLDLYGNYSFVWVGSEDDAQADEHQQSTPAHTLNLGGQYRWKGLTLGTDLHAQSGQTWPIRAYNDDGEVVITRIDQPGWIQLSAHTAWRFKGGLELAIDGHNLLEALNAERESSESTVGTPQGVHREHPQGQLVPTSVVFSLTMPL